MADKKQPPEAAKKIGEAIAKAMGIDPNKIQMIDASVGKYNEDQDRREKTLDELFELHRADAMAVVEAAKEQRFDHACCDDCAVRAIAGGQMEGALKAYLKLVPRADLFPEVAALHNLITEVLEDMLGEDDEGETEEVIE